MPPEKITKRNEDCRTSRPFSALEPPCRPAAPPGRASHPVSSVQQPHSYPNADAMGHVGAKVQTLEGWGRAGKRTAGSAQAGEAVAFRRPVKTSQTSCHVLSENKEDLGC